MGTKDAFIGYAENNETIASEFEVAEEEIKKVKKMFNLEAANADLKKRQDLLKKSINGTAFFYIVINDNFYSHSSTKYNPNPEFDEVSTSHVLKAGDEVKIYYYNHKGEGWQCNKEKANF